MAFCYKLRYSGKIGVTATCNMKNNIVYGVSRQSIPRALLEAPVEKFTKGFIMWKLSVVVV